MIVKKLNILAFVGMAFAGTSFVNAMNFEEGVERSFTNRSQRDNSRIDPKNDRRNISRNDLNFSNILKEKSHQNSNNFDEFIKKEKRIEEQRIRERSCEHDSVTDLRDYSRIDPLNYLSHC